MQWMTVAVLKVTQCWSIINTVFYCQKKDHMRFK